MHHQQTPSLRLNTNIQPSGLGSHPIPLAEDKVSRTSDLEQQNIKSHGGTGSESRREIARRPGPGAITNRPVPGSALTSTTRGHQPRPPNPPQPLSTSPPVAEKRLGSAWEAPDAKTRKEQLSQNAKARRSDKAAESSLKTKLSEPSGGSGRQRQDQPRGGETRPPTGRKKPQGKEDPRSEVPTHAAGDSTSGPSVASR